jgi:alcohol-forming fatty acyl-CoA reductase
MIANEEDGGPGRRLVSRPEEQSIAGRQHDDGRGDLRFALTRHTGNLFVRMGSIGLRKVLRRCAEHVTFDRPSFERALAGLDASMMPIIVPTHRSYMDFLICPYLFYAQPELGLALPHIAAASEFARIPIVGWLLTKGGAFYVHRGIGRANADLGHRIRQMVARRATLQFFIEGKRSRSRQFLPPRRGLLRVLQSTGQPCVLLPIAISYDRRSDELSLLDEVRGGGKTPMTLRELIGWMKRWRGGEVQLGRIHLACGKPLVMDGASDVRAVALAIMSELQACTCATTHHLASFLHHARPPGVDMTWLRSALLRRGVTVLEGGIDGPDLDAVAERGMRHHYIHGFFGDALARWPGDPAVGSFVRANAYQPVPDPPHDDADDPRLSALLEALFGVVRREYEAVVRGLLAARANGATRPGTRSWQLDGAYLPVVDSAFDDLARRGILRKGDTNDTFSWGPEPGQLADLAAQLSDLDSPARGSGPTLRRGDGPVRRVPR